MIAPRQSLDVPAAETHGTHRPGKVPVAVASMLRLQGYRDPASVRSDIREIASAMAARADELIEPLVIYRFLDIEACSEGALTLEAGTTFRGGASFAVLRDCRRVAVFVLTLGGRLDKEIEGRAAAGEILEALFLGTAGWLAVEGATKAFSRHLRASAGPGGCRLTRRVGPGYGDWALSEQKDLFALFAGGPFAGEACPVRLLASCAMLPRMSRSGLYGLRP